MDMNVALRAGRGLPDFGDLPAGRE